MLLIDGQWVPGNGDNFNSTDPSNSQQIWEGMTATADDVDRAFLAARKAFPSWSNTPFEKRVEIVQNLKQLAIDYKADLAELIARETGKVLWDASGEAGAVAGKVDISLKAYDDRTGTSSLETAFGRADLAHRPHGVFAVLGPYNFPAHLPNGQIIPALIAGNTIVYKPSEQCPAVGAFMASLYQKAGVPDGVINMVQGARDTGAAILDHDELDGVLFTGSPGTGKFIHKKFGGRPEIVLALEMGGNNPLLMWDVADAKAAASIIFQSNFITTGQRCTCARRILLPVGEAGDDVIANLVDMRDNMTIGAWNDEDPTFMGPLISADVASDVKRMADELATKHGGKVLRPMESLERSEAFVTPAILDVTGKEMPDEEIFGPVMQIIRVESFDQGIQIANDTKYGLSAGLISDDTELWNLFRRNIRAGVVNFNRPTTGAAGSLPFGGPGASGNHNPGAYYSADFCAWPMASQIAETVELQSSQGVKI
ncbi:MAG: succinylglutamate-semialdehyde dehydrogenase [Acidimicrobiales bacterium]|nr:succinylglutamate-semialdehyde dehydrogenase [Hyphomonadaceae bacterium]RZV40605.1 MAG: succinylglutamate-semialdehyde dehydrogenase [Acidimicrobiales bacterium]